MRKDKKKICIHLHLYDLILIHTIAEIHNFIVRKVYDYITTVTVDLIKSFFFLVTGRQVNLHIEICCMP